MGSKLCLAVNGASHCHGATDSRNKQAAGCLPNGGKRGDPASPDRRHWSSGGDNIVSSQCYRCELIVNRLHLWSAL